MWGGYWGRLIRLENRYNSIFNQKVQDYVTLRALIYLMSCYVSLIVHKMKIKLKISSVVMLLTIFFFNKQRKKYIVYHACSQEEKTQIIR